MVGGGRPLYRKLRGKYGMGDSVHARRRSEVSRNARSGRRNDDRESLPYLDTAKSGDRFRIGTRAHLGKKAGPSPEKAADPPPAPKPQWVRDQGFCAIGNGGPKKADRPTILQTPEGTEIRGVFAQIHLGGWDIATPLRCLSNTTRLDSRAAENSADHMPATKSEVGGIATSDDRPSVTCDRPAATISARDSATIAIARPSPKIRPVRPAPVTTCARPPSPANSSPDVETTRGLQTLVGTRPACMGDWLYRRNLARDPLRRAQLYT